jgi:hypothetical protein
MHDAKPYGVAIRQAVASGDLQKMKSTLAEADKYNAAHGDVSAALQVLRFEIAKLEPAR